MESQNDAQRKNQFPNTEEWKLWRFPTTDKLLCGLGISSVACSLSTSHLDSMVLIFIRSKSVSSVFKQLSERLMIDHNKDCSEMLKAGFGGCIDLSQTDGRKGGSSNNRPDSSKSLKNQLLLRQPKRPAGAYACFMQTVFPGYQARLPGKPVYEIGREIALAWRALEPEEKREYLDRANENKKIYTEAVKAFNLKLTDEEKGSLEEQLKMKRECRQRRRLKAERRSLKMPQKPRNAYSFFVQSVKRDKDEDIVTFARKCGARWQSMDKAARNTFEDLALKDNERYFKDIEAWEMRMLQTGHLNVIRSKSRMSTLSVMRKELNEKARSDKKKQQVKQKKRDSDKVKRTPK
ncbi:hypothetical protein ACOME3_009714 [Neoechinorhynchus agilis]